MADRPRAARAGVDAVRDHRDWARAEMVDRHPARLLADFSEIPLNDGVAIADFVQRYGDPSASSMPRKPVHTARWGDLASALAAIADAWDGHAERHQPFQL